MPPLSTHTLLAAVLPLTASAFAAPAQQDPAVTIAEIHGPGWTSPMLGEHVNDVRGVVTAVEESRSVNGFWFQAPEDDGDHRTSEALFVFNGSDAVDVTPGDAVAVDGRVAEYSPGDGNQAVTQLNDASWTVLSADNPLPTPVKVGEGTVPTEFAAESAGPEPPADDLQPDTYALDFWASQENMLIRVEDVRVVSPTSPYGDFWVTVEPDLLPTERGGALAPTDHTRHTGLIKIEPLPEAGPLPDFTVGDTLTGVTAGPLSYSQFGGYTLRATELGQHEDGGLDPAHAPPAEDWELSVATYNLENLSAADDAEKFDALAEDTVTALDAPDILGVQEIQDNDGAEDSGNVDAAETLDTFTDAIADAGGPDYEWRQIDPEDGHDGGRPGANIRNALLFRPDRVEFVDRGEPDATTPVEVREDDAGRAALHPSPGRIDPDNDVWDNSRKPLVGEFRFQDRPVFVAVNHLNSKLGDQSWHGPSQPPERHSEPDRHAMAEVHRDWVDAIQDIEPDANIVALGDFNDFPHSETLRILMEDGGLHNPMLDLPEEERHNYIYDGGSQALDHILVNRGLAHRADYHIGHINAEFPDPSSDHDPQVVRFLPLTGDEDADRADDDTHYDGAQPRDDAELDALIPAPEGEERGETPWVRSTMVGGAALAAGVAVWQVARRHYARRQRA